MFQDIKSPKNKLFIMNPYKSFEPNTVLFYPKYPGMKFEYYDFMKIGEWVNKNIKYDYSFIGRSDLTASDILKIRIGVCEHFTKLYNALIYSLGYKVIYVNGFACENSSDFDHNCAHAWSLINVNGKWYPFDATWDILTGKLPVCHVFQGFFGKSMNLVGIDGAIFARDSKESGKYIK